MQEDDENTVRVLSVPEAGRLYLGISKNSAYAAARRGEMPVIRVGRRLCVPVVALERMLANAGQMTSAFDAEPRNNKGTGGGAT